MAKYTIDKQVLIQESFLESFRGSLNRNFGKEYSTKDGYSKNPDGTIKHSFAHEQKDDKQLQDQIGYEHRKATGTMNMSDLDRNFKDAGELGHH